MDRLSLKLGHCGDAEGCAFEKSSCMNPSGWRSPGEMTGNAPYRAHGGYCLLHETVQEAVLGRCGTGAAGLCAPNRESCEAAFLGNPETNLFDKIEPDCTVESTSFGKCGDRCSWSPLDCGPGEAWTFPAEECSCDKVRTGGCVLGDGGADGDAYCAVSEDGCGGGLSWLSPLEMDARGVGAECYLCMEETAPVEEQGGVSVPAAASEGEGSSSPSTSVVVGATVGGAVLAALLAALIVRCKKQKRQSKAVNELDDETSAGTPAQLPMDLKVRGSDIDNVSNLGIEDCNL